MVSKTKQFELRVLLSVTTGRLLTKGKGEVDNGIGDIYDLLGWMTNDSPFTHQLPRFADECKPWLLRWFPELLPLTGDVIAFCNGLEGMTRDQIGAAIDGFVWGLGERIGQQSFDVPRIPADDHDRKDPIDELVAMRGTDEAIVIVESEETNG